MGIEPAMFPSPKAVLVLKMELLEGIEPAMFPSPKDVLVLKFNFGAAGVNRTRDVSFS